MGLCRIGIVSVALELDCLFVCLFLSRTVLICKRMKTFNGFFYLRQLMISTVAVAVKGVPLGHVVVLSEFA